MVGESRNVTITFTSVAETPEEIQQEAYNIAKSIHSVIAIQYMPGVWDDELEPEWFSGATNEAGEVYGG